MLEYFEQQLALSLDAHAISPRLKDAMRYCLLSEGKRLRPQLVMLAAKTVARDADWPQVLNAAIAVEYVHTYSLIHDDLPAMDDDDFRRGRPSCHKQFDEATAILAGDALLTDAFWHLSHATHQPAEQVRELAHAIGSGGMISGQIQDILALGDALDINQKKTALLFAACAALGGMSVGASETKVSQLREFGLCLGLAFQFVDDALDEDDSAFAMQLADKYTTRAIELARHFENGQILIDFAQRLLARSN